jgi:uncharacterized protein YybS (DUF2232 family)
MMRRKRTTVVFAVKAFRKYFEGAFKVPHGDAAVHNKPLDLMEKGRMVASTASLLYTLPGTMTLIGGFCFSMMRTCIGEVWVRRTMLSDI